MATLVVTFSGIDATHHFTAPVARGASVRSETLTLPATGALAALAGDGIVELLADADCTVNIGPAPVTTANISRKLKSGIPYQFSVVTGDKVAVS